MFINPWDLGGIDPRVLKELADVMAGPLSIIYQRSWESGEVPADCKLVHIIPICKIISQAHWLWASSNQVAAIRHVPHGGFSAATP